VSFRREIDIRMWGDEKFRQLSGPQPNAQTLWTWLITGPATTPVPGLIPIGKAAMAEQLRWPVQATERCFGEVQRQGMAFADWDAPLIWLPNGVKYRLPRNEKQAKGWLSYLDAVPDCELKRVATGSIYTVLHAQVPKFTQTWVERYGIQYLEQYASRFQNLLAASLETLPPGVKGVGGRGLGVGERGLRQETIPGLEPQVLEAELVATPEDIQAAWNVRAPPLPRWTVLTENRRRAAKQRLAQHSLDEIRQAIDLIASSEFCLGKNDRAWRANPEFLLRPDTVTKALEGQYGNREKGDFEPEWKRRGYASPDDFQDALEKDRARREREEQR
jgi:hypothetical protein